MKDPLDPQTVERLMAGALDPSDAPPGYAVVASLIRALHGSLSPEDLGREHATVMAMARALGAEPSLGDVEVPDVKLEGIQQLGPELLDVKFSDLDPSDVRSAAGEDVRTPPAPPVPIRTPAPPVTLDRIAWAGEPATGSRRMLGMADVKRRGERRRPLKARVAALATAALILCTAVACTSSGPSRWRHSRV